MAFPKIFNIFTIIIITTTTQLCFFAYCSIQYPISPSIILYSGKEQTGKEFNSQVAYIPDLSKRGFDNQVQSVCVNGTWLLYNEPNYNKDTIITDASIMEYVSGFSYCTDLKILDQKVSSLRFVGSALDVDCDTITIYSKPYFQGEEEYFTESADYLEILNNDGNLTTTSSLIVTGSNTWGWRLFEMENFQGGSICIQASDDDAQGVSNLPRVLLIPNITEKYNDFLGFVSSLKQELCF